MPFSAGTQREPRTRRSRRTGVSGETRHVGATREHEGPMDWHEDRLLIDGELVAAEGGATYDTINPATEDVLGSSADATVGDAKRAIAAARRAFDTTEWSRDVGLRQRCLRQFHQALQQNFDALRDILVEEVGAPV